MEYRTVMNSFTAVQFEAFEFLRFQEKTNEYFLPFPMKICFRCKGFCYTKMLNDPRVPGSGFYCMPMEGAYTAKCDECLALFS